MRSRTVISLDRVRFGYHFARVSCTESLPSSCRSSVSAATNSLVTEPMEKRVSVSAARRGCSDASPYAFCSATCPPRMSVTESPTRRWSFMPAVTMLSTTCSSIGACAATAAGASVAATSRTRATRDAAPPRNGENEEGISGRVGGRSGGAARGRRRARSR